MAKLKEDKKREILEFLEDNAANEQLLPLESDRIANEFADERFDEDSITEIISDLKEDGLVVKKTARLEVVYPSSHEDSIEDKFEHLFERSIFAIYFVGAVGLLFLLTQDSVFTALFDEVAKNPEEIVNRAVVLGIVGAYVLGATILWGYDTAQKHFEILQEYRYLLYPTFTIGLATAGVAFAYSNYSS